MTNQMKQVAAAVLALAMVAALYVYEQHSGGSKMVYTASGYGGFEAVARKPARAPKPVERTIMSTTGSEESAGAPKASPSIDAEAALQPVQEAYRGGDYAQAGRVAREVAAALSHSGKPAFVQAAVEARDIAAYSDARQKKYSAARQEFAVLQSDAESADGGPRKDEGGRMKDEARKIGIDPVVLGKPAAGEERMQEIEQDAGYQHAVLTAALGDKAAAEREYLSFMKQYPGSPLASAAMKRVEQMHGGNLPEEAAAVWRQTSEEAEKQQKQQELAESMCGPECLAELLRRGDPNHRGTENTEKSKRKNRIKGPGNEGGAGAGLEAQSAEYGVRSAGLEAQGTGDGGPGAEEVQALAREMGTSGKGTSMEAMRSAAEEHGLSLRGVQLSWRGLMQQKLPAIGLEFPGHYVLIEQVGPKGVTVWDPDSEGVGQPGRRVYSKNQWEQIWGRTALVFAR